MRSPAGWQSEATVYGAAVYPLMDSLPHDVDSRDCACGPKVEPLLTKNGVRKIVTHNAWDGRE